MIFLKEYSAPPISIETALKFTGDPHPSAEITALMEKCANDTEKVFTYKVCAEKCRITVTENSVDFGFATAESKSLAKTLFGCSFAMVFAATVGLGIDRAIHRYAALSPARALCLQALGAERIEALCDRFQAETEKEEAQIGNSITVRFSPGYGDLSLAFQTEIFKELDCARTIGLTLNDSLLMSPTKSVTAIFGITEEQTHECSAIFTE